MTFLPIVERELRVGARQRMTFRLRFWAAAAVIALWLLLVWSNRRMAPAQLSMQLFTSFSVLALGFCLLAGVFLTADCLSEEKREGTLGLLFLTDLRGYDVVLGKLVATSLRAVYALLSILPVLALPLLMGGVTGGESFRVMLVLLASMFLSLSLGLLVSAWQSEARQSLGGSLLGLIVLTGGFPALYWLLRLVFNARSLSLLLLPSPAYALQVAFASPYRTRAGAHDFWFSLGLLLFLGGLFLCLSAMLLPRVWRQTRSTEWPRSSSAESRGSKASSQVGAGLGLPVSNARRGLEQNPFFWLACRGPTLGGLLGRGGVLLALLWSCFFAVSMFSRQNKPAFVICLFLSYAVHQLFKYAMAQEATRRLSEDRRSGALELLLVTPLSEAQIISGQKQALGRRFAGHNWLLVLLNFALCAAVLLSRNLGMSGTDRAIFLELFLGGVVMLLLDFKTIGAVGMACALRAKRPQRALLETLARVLFAPWAAVFVLVFAFQGIGLSPGGVAGLFGLWFLLGAINDAVTFGWAQASLARGFRAVVSAEPAPAAAPRPAPAGLLRPQGV